MKFWACTSLFALFLAGCLRAPSERIMTSSEPSERVLAVNGWDVGCDNLGQCVAIGALPPRKVKLDGIRGALRVAFHADREPDLAIIPLDFEELLPDVKPSAHQAASLLRQLRTGDEFMLWHQDNDGSRYYLPGKDFAQIESLLRQRRKNFSVPLVQQEPIVPTKAAALGGFVTPELTEAQLTGCKAPNKGDIEAVWAIGGEFYLLRYTCSINGSARPLTLWFTQDKKSGKLVGIGIDEAVGPRINDKAAGLYNAHFEPTQGLLVTRKIDSTRDCGAVAAYAATPLGFLLAERREARHCIGLFERDWIRTYRNPAIVLPKGW
ncbi:MAG: hypothetical protein EAZ43_10565 [Betaproteobacteria bacterium]|nr:MAG: hypothetical protein EAZ43_10565 [Betaproteobacteria bacterium]